MAELLTKISIWLVIACYGFVVATSPKRFARGTLLASMRTGAWWLGGVAFAVHVLLAFSAFYQWSWEIAWQATADQAEALSGVSAGWGLWLNFAFGAAWLALALRERGRSRRWIDRVLHGFLFFMVLMGGIVFAPSAARRFTLAVFVCAAVTGLVILRSQRRRSAAFARHHEN